MCACSINNCMYGRRSSSCCQGCCLTVDCFSNSERYFPKMPSSCTKCYELTGLVSPLTPGCLYMEAQAGWKIHKPWPYMHVWQLVHCFFLCRFVSWTLTHPLCFVAVHTKHTQPPYASWSTWTTDHAHFCAITLSQTSRRQLVVYLGNCISELSL